MWISVSRLARSGDSYRKTSSDWSATWVGTRRNQGKRLAKSIVADLRGRKVKPYKHHRLGTVATLGPGKGIFQYRRIVIKGPLAWLMHRGYHVLAIPTWERKVRVALVWGRPCSTVATSCRCCRCSTRGPSSSPPAGSSRTDEAAAAASREGSE